MGRTKTWQKKKKTLWETNSTFPSVHSGRLNFSGIWLPIKFCLVFWGLVRIERVNSTWQLWIIILDDYFRLPPFCSWYWHHCTHPGKNMGSYQHKGTVSMIHWNYYLSDHGCSHQTLSSNSHDYPPQILKHLWDLPSFIQETHDPLRSLCFSQQV